MQIHPVKPFALDVHVDERGQLYSLEFSSLPFQPRRLFFVEGASPGEKRGGHAHRNAHQVFVCLMGSVTVAVHDRGSEQDFTLDRPGMALYIPPRVWSEQTYVDAGSRLLVLSSEPFDSTEYVHEVE
jgi:dTDP-4-dehydrorhamnose 3,5-epimerase-like enzyme